MSQLLRPLRSDPDFETVAAGDHPGYLPEDILWRMERGLPTERMRRSRLFITSSKVRLFP